MKKSPRKVKKVKKHDTKKTKKSAWDTISVYVRRSEHGLCFTCGVRKDWREMDCGHFRHNSERNQTLGGNALWYDIRNLHCQCSRCNRFQHGNLAMYAEKLEALYGFGVVQEIHRLYQTYKLWSIEEIKQVIETYKQKTLDLED